MGKLQPIRFCTFWIPKRFIIKRLQRAGVWNKKKNNRKTSCLRQIFGLMSCLKTSIEVVSMPLYLLYSSYVGRLLQYVLLSSILFYFYTQLCSTLYHFYSCYFFYLVPLIQQLFSILYMYAFTAIIFDFIPLLQQQYSTLYHFYSSY